MSRVFIDESTLTGIADAIRSKEGTAELIPPLEMPARIEALGGGVNYLNYCQGCTFASLNLFGAKKVEITLPQGRNLNNMFASVYDSYEEYNDNANTTVEELIIHCPNPITGIQQIFNLHTQFADKTLKKITFDVDFSKTKNLNYAFKNLQALEVIDGNPIYVGAVNGALNAFWGDGSNLKEIRFSGKYSAGNWSFGSTPTKLSKESIISIIACLSDEAAGKTLTIPLAAVNAAFETSEGAADGSTSAEWLALIAAHSNWTISLV